MRAGSASTARAAAALLFILAGGLLPRLVLICEFPVIAVSDFDSLIRFGIFLCKNPLTDRAWFWGYLNPGLPLLLSVLFRIFPDADPASVARDATGVASGLLPLIPFFVWRGVLPCGSACWPDLCLRSGLGKSSFAAWLLRITGSCSPPRALEHLPCGRF